MSKNDLTAYRLKLESMVHELLGKQSRLRNEMRGTEADGGKPDKGEQFTDDDLSREAAEGEVALSLLDNEEELLTECRAALARLEAGTFGSCTQCGKPIAKERLATMPCASRCIGCAREFELQAE